VSRRRSYSLTLVDSLDTLLVVGAPRRRSSARVDSLLIVGCLCAGQPREFRRAVGWLCENLDFDRDIAVSVFETNIRVLGSLLSAHLLARDDGALGVPAAHVARLLALALDLGRAPAARVRDADRHSVRHGEPAPRRAARRDRRDVRGGRRHVRRRVWRAERAERRRGL
jgi:hypothetical protein